jgi:hypothetical protein
MIPEAADPGDVVVVALERASVAFEAKDYARAGELPAAIARPRR